ncbi:hypothetical protein OG792_08785 [Micromonospora sp. NBC_01699]|uniref:hypothetical protein n=1 Tax=Micromonospora sp. NBC_01699 TaxID=2975984 RepID=UPI002E35C3FE|nr:hypothetical protein [Micromonospora sp. NBC_01699]
MTESHTVVLDAVPEPPPVFVDATGRRRRFVRYLAYGIGLLGLTYTALVGISLAGGPVNPNSVLPFADLVGRPQAPLPSPVPVAPVDAVSTAQPSDDGSPVATDRAGRPSATPSGTANPARTVTSTGGPLATQPANTVPDPQPPVVPDEPPPAVPDDPPVQPTPPIATEPPVDPLADPVNGSAR